MADLSVKPKFAGVPLTIAGQKILVPSLTLRQFEEYADVLTAPIPEDMDLAAQVKKFQPAMLAALQRNYPDLTVDDFYDFIDLNTFREVFTAVQGASGLKVVQPGE